MAGAGLPLAPHDVHGDSIRSAHQGRPGAGRSSGGGSGGGGRVGSGVGCSVGCGVGNWVGRGVGRGVAAACAAEAALLTQCVPDVLEKENLHEALHDVTKH